MTDDSPGGTREDPCPDANDNTSQGCPDLPPSEVDIVENSDDAGKDSYPDEIEQTTQGHPHEPSIEQDLVIDLDDVADPSSER